MSESKYGHIKERALDTAKAIRKGQAVANADAAYIELAVQAIEELELEQQKTRAGLVEVLGAVREVRNAFQE